MIRLGFVGLGRVLDYHLPAIEACDGAVEISAVYDISAERTTAVADRLRACPHASFEALLADPDVDVVVIATPPTLHAAHVLQALEHDKHVLVEKPMALRVDDARKMVEAAEARGKVLTVNHNHRFSPFFRYQEVRATIESGAIGRPHRYLVELMSPWGGYEGAPGYVSHWECRKEFGGGTLFSWGPHVVDMLVYAHGAAPVSVYATLDSVGWSHDGDSNSTTVLTFGDGAVATIDLSYVAPFEFKTFYVQGDAGALQYDSGSGAVLVKSGDLDAGFADAPVPEVPEQPRWIYGSLLGAVLRGEPLEVTPRHALVVVATLEAAARSAAEKRVVTLDEVLS